MCALDQFANFKNRSESQTLDTRDNGNVESASNHVPPNTFRHRMRKLACRVESLLSTLGLRRRPLLYEIVRELDSLIWRIRMIRNSSDYRRNRYFPIQIPHLAKSHHRQRIEERFHTMDTRWLLANFPAASWSDVRLFHLGWERRAMHSEQMAQFSKEAPSSTNNQDVCTECSPRVQQTEIP